MGLKDSQVVDEMFVCWAGVNEEPSEVGRSGCEGGEGDAGSWWEGHDESCLGRGAFEISLRHLRDI